MHLISVSKYCQSQNIRDLKPAVNIQDACFKSLAIRVQLDAFWAQSKETVKGYVCKTRFMAQYGAALGFLLNALLGPFCLSNHNGMMHAIILEMRTM